MGWVGSGTKTMPFCLIENSIMGLGSGIRTLLKGLLNFMRPTEINLQHVKTAGESANAALY